METEVLTRNIKHRPLKILIFFLESYKSYRSILSQITMEQQSKAKIGKSPGSDGIQSDGLILIQVSWTSFTKFSNFSSIYDGRILTKPSGI